MGRSPIADYVPGRDPAFAHAVAVRDRLAELQRRVGDVMDALERRPRAPDGEHLADNPETRALFHELGTVMRDADEAIASIRQLMKSPPE